MAAEWAAGDWASGQPAADVGDAVERASDVWRAVDVRSKYLDCGATAGTEWMESGCIKSYGVAKPNGERAVPQVRLQGL